MKQWVLIFLLAMTTSTFAANQAVITTTDFSSGSFSSVDLSSNVASNDHLTIHSDASIKTYLDKIYIINRLGQDNVIVLSKDDLKTPLTQYSVGNGTNPHDMAFVSESKAYISRYGQSRLLVVNPTTGDSLGSVDLSGFADADGLPEQSQLALYNNRLFVACQRLDQNNGFVATEFSVIAVVDVTTDQLIDVDANTAGVQGIVMQGKNPSGVSQVGDKWVMSTVNTFGDLSDGGIEVIDLANLESEGVVVGESVLGGNVNSLVMVSDNKGYVVVSDANFSNLVKGFDLLTKSVSANLSNISGGFIPSLGVFNGRLYVLDRGSFSDPSSGGVKVFDVTTNQLVAGPINTGLPPSTITFVGEETPRVVDYTLQDAVLTTTDFSSGSFSSMDLSSNVASNDHLTVHSDAAVRTYLDKVYIINRLGQDNVIVLSKDNLKTPLTQYSVGNGTNPHDMAFVSESKAYISRYGQSRLLVVNPTTGDSLGSVDLSGFADADGLPEQSQLALYNNRLFVACQRLDQNNGFVATEFSVIAVVDVTTDQLIDVDANTAGVQGIVMQGKNPSGVSQVGDKWVMSTVNTFGDLSDGGIEVIDLANLESEGVVIGESVLGGNVNSLVMVSDNKGYVVVSDANFANLVKGFDLLTKSVSANLSNISGGFIPSLNVFGERLYVLDRGSFSDPASGGVKVFDVNTNQILAGPIATGLPPSTIAFTGNVGVGSSLTGDFNGDGAVSFPDFLAFAAAFGKSASDSGFDVKFDLNGNGTVDFPDFLSFASAFNAASK